MNTLMIDSGPVYDRIALYRNGTLDDLLLESAGAPSVVGHIYKGRVERVEPGLDAAFVDIGLGKSGYLGIRDMLPPDKRKDAQIRDHIRGGQELLVQVIKDIREEKGVQLTTRITLPGKYLVLTPDEPVISLSNKIIGNSRRKQLGDGIQALMPPDMGAVVRTDAASADPKLVEAELNRLLALWQKIAAYKVLGAAPMLVFKEASPARRMLRRINPLELHRICSNNRLQTAEVLEYLAQKGLEAPEVRESFETEPLTDAVQEALQPFVPLPGGGSLWIETTRALTIIDVNSGGNIGPGDAQSTFLRVNLAAAVEIARQLRLRNISGMIMIDFIDVRSADSRRAVVAALKDAAAPDRMPVAVMGYTKLGILELTRKAEQPALRETLTVPCACCTGTGQADAPGLLLERLDLELKRLAEHTTTKTVILEMDPTLYSAVHKGLMGGFSALTSRYELTVSVKECRTITGYRVVRE